MEHFSHENKNYFFNSAKIGIENELYKQFNKMMAKFYMIFSIHQQPLKKIDRLRTKICFQISLYSILFHTLGAEMNQ